MLTNYENYLNNILIIQIMVNLIWLDSFDLTYDKIEGWVWDF